MRKASPKRDVMQADVQALFDHGQADYTLYNRVFRTAFPLTMHYGLWEASTASLREANHATNDLIARVLALRPGDRILDAGCGVGGTAIYLAQTYGVRVDGITLSPVQTRAALAYAHHYQVVHLTTFSTQDYHRTCYPDAAFDKIYSLEAASHANPVVGYLHEMYRLLRPGGKLGICDAWLARPRENLAGQAAAQVARFCHGWAIADPQTQASWVTQMRALGLQHVQAHIFTDKIQPSSRRIFLLAVGCWPLYHMLYALRLVSPMQMHNLRCAILQRALFKRGILHYGLITAEK